MIGQASRGPPNSYNWVNPSAGNYNIFARVTYNGGSVMDSAAVGITVVSANVNLGFETPSIGSGNFASNASGASWTFGGSEGIVANGSIYNNPNAPEGVQAAYMQSYGSMSQTLYGFTPGVTYTITFFAAQRGAVENGGQSWNVMIDNTVITNCNPGATAMPPTPPASRHRGDSTPWLCRTIWPQATILCSLTMCKWHNPTDRLVPAASCNDNTLPVTAADVVGSQSLSRRGSAGEPIRVTYQWQKISGGATNNIPVQRNTTLTLANLQLTNTAAYQLQASNAFGVAVSTPSSLTVSSVPAAVD